MGYLDNAGLSRFYEGIKSRYFLKANVANDLTTTEAGKALDARQGKALDASVKAAIARAEQSSSPYAHSRTGTVHELTGTGKLGHTVMTADYEDGDTFAVNGEAVTVVGEVDELVEGSAMIFSLEEDGLYIYAISNPFAVPDGETALPLGSVKIWIECTGLRYAQVGSPSLTAVLADESLLGALFSSINAMNYLVRSTELQAAVYNNQTAINALDASIPFVSAVMTDNDQPEGYSVYDPSGTTAADMYQITNEMSTAWYGHGYDAKGKSFSVVLKLPQAVWPYRITMKGNGYRVANNAFTGNTPLQYTIYGSGNGESWTKLTDDTVVDLALTPQSQRMNYYKVTVTGSTSGQATIGHLQGLRVWGK